MGDWVGLYDHFISTPPPTTKRVDGLSKFGWSSDHGAHRPPLSLRLPTLTYLPTYVYVLCIPNLTHWATYLRMASDLTDWLVRYCFACLAHLAWAWLGGLSQYLGTDDLNPSARSSRVLRAAFRLVSVDSFDLVFWFTPLITDAYQPCVQRSARAHTLVICTLRLPSFLLHLLRGLLFFAE